MVSKDLNKVFLDLLYMAREHDTAPDWAMGLKLGEECGEVQTALLHKHGFLKHKTLDEDVMHEIADVMNVCVAIMTAHYPEHTPDELYEGLVDAMIKKGRKYAKVLDVPYYGDKEL